MKDLIGRTLGHYRVVEKIGAGGMGVVYRARDERLDRDVAIKVLPEEMARDEERLDRFEREAKLLASLSHQNIATLYGLEEHDGQRYLVMELAEGETLADRIERAPIPIDDAIDYARQIAEGLEAAHERGIIHRDLKPANVMLSPEGKLKILDFGLAKAYEPPGSEPSSPQSIADSPTITAGMTRTGVLLGTAAYMSPEQARGKAVDKRADIWAFGCVLYEMLTGRKAFQGNDASQVMAAILRDDPDGDALPPATPIYIRRLLTRCLVKNPRDRLHDIADARIEIEEALSVPAESEPSLSDAQTRRRRWIPAILGCSAGAAAISAIFVWNMKPVPQPPPAGPVVRTSIELPAAMQLSRGKWGPTRTCMALSPDGTHAVYSASPSGVNAERLVTPADESSRHMSQGQTRADRKAPALDAEAQLFLHPLSQNRATPLPGTDGGICPFFSPDGQWIKFWAKGELKRVPVAGGPPVTICPSPVPPFGASWGNDGTIVFGRRTIEGLWQVPDVGGEPEVLTIPDPATGEASHRLPQVLPGGEYVLFTVMPHFLGTDAHIEVLNLGTGERKILIEDGADARYTSTGHLVFARVGILLAAPFDLAKLEVTGAAVPLVDGVSQALNLHWGFCNTGAAQYAISDSGSLLYLPGGIYDDPELSLFWVDRTGRRESLARFEGFPLSPRVSPDGQRVAFTAGSRARNLWAYNIHSGSVSRVTFEGTSLFVNWTPDGKRVTFDSFRSGSARLFWQPWDGSGTIEPLVPSGLEAYSDWGVIEHFPGPWSPDGKHLVFVVWGFDEHLRVDADIWVFHAEDQRVTPLVKTEFQEGYPDLSPDGRWLAYASNESDRLQVYVRPFPGPGGKITISTEGGQSPVWGSDGRELFYRSGGKMMVVDIVADPVFSAGPPRPLFEDRYGFGVPIRSYDITPDGQRFLFVEDLEANPQEATRMNLVLNWFDELNRLAPPG